MRRGGVIAHKYVTELINDLFTCLGKYEVKRNSNLVPNYRQVECMYCIRHCTPVLLQTVSQHVLNRVELR